MALARTQLGLSRSHRLRQSGEFSHLRETGRRVACGCLVANWTIRSGAAHSRVGVIASRRIGPAVVRNRAKRLLREAFRLHQHEFSEPVDLVLIARHSIVGRTRHQVERDLLKALSPAGLRVS